MNEVTKAVINEIVELVNQLTYSEIAALNDTLSTKMYRMQKAEKENFKSLLGE